MQLFVYWLLNWSDGPVDRVDTLIVLALVFRLNRLHISETVIFQRVAYYFNVTILQIEVVAPIWRLVRSDRHRIFIGSKYEVILLNVFTQIPAIFSLSQLASRLRNSLQTGLIREIILSLSDKVVSAESLPCGMKL